MKELRQRTLTGFVFPTTILWKRPHCYCAAVETCASFPHNDARNVFHAQTSSPSQDRALLYHRTAEICRWLNRCHQSLQSALRALLFLCRRSRQREELSVEKWIEKIEAMKADGHPMMLCPWVGGEPMVREQLSAATGHRTPEREKSQPEQLLTALYLIGGLLIPGRFLHLA